MCYQVVTVFFRPYCAAERTGERDIYWNIAMAAVPIVLLLISLAADPIGVGDHHREMIVADLERNYLIHVPKGYDPKKPAPVVLALHGAAMNGSMMVWFSGLNKKSDEAGFIVVYPSGAGTFWNAGGIQGKLAEGRADDVAFIGKVLDDVATVLTVDEKRIYACGMSNGAMMCYRLAAEMSDRVAAIAPVAGTIAIEESKPKRPVPVIHFHGTKDQLVPFQKRQGRSVGLMKLKDVDETVMTWVKLNGCSETPTMETISEEGDEIRAIRKSYGGGKDGAEVVLVVLEEGGHTWPGQKPPVGFIGKSAKISANDLLWAFFEKHPMK